MDDIFVGRLMSSPVHTVHPDDSVQAAARVMSEHDVGSVVVVDDDDGLSGIVTSTDFVRIVLDGRAASETPVSGYTTTDVVTTTVNEPIRDVADTMIEQGFHHVPVVDDVEGVVGMLTTKDLTAYLSHVQTPSPAQ